MKTLPEPQDRSPQSHSATRWRTLLALGPAFVVVLLGIATFYGFRGAVTSREAVIHTRDVIETTQAVLSDIQNAETGERGFIITGDESYLEPYTKGLAALHADSAQLRRLTVDNRTQQLRLDTLAFLIGKRLATLAEGVASRRSRGLDSAADVVRNGRGRELMNDVRVRLANINTTEQALLESRRAAQTRREKIVSLLIIVGTIVAVILALAINGMLFRSAEAEARLARDVETRNQQL